MDDAVRVRERDRLTDSLDDPPVARSDGDAGSASSGRRARASSRRTLVRPRACRRRGRARSPDVPAARACAPHAIIRDGDIRRDFGQTDDLERHVTRQLAIARAVHGAHAALPDALDDLVLRAAQVRRVGGVTQPTERGIGQARSSGRSRCQAARGPRGGTRRPSRTASRSRSSTRSTQLSSRERQMVRHLRDRNPELRSELRVRWSGIAAVVEVIALKDLELRELAGRRARLAQARRRRRRTDARTHS